MASENKAVVRRYMEAFNCLDHAAILELLDDEVEWVMPGAFHHRGKAAFDREIENPEFPGVPVIETTREVEESDVVVSEGTVRGKLKDGSPFLAAFADIFEFRGGKIRKLTSYVVPVRS
jgi:uncharacterized protein